MKHTIALFSHRDDLSAALTETIGQDTLHVHTPGEPLRRATRAVILDMASYDEESALFAFVHTLRCPALILVQGHQEALQLLDRLPPRCDIVLDSDPPALIQHRLTRLLLAVTEARDALTGLHSRTAFLEHLADAMSQCTEDQPCSVLFIDIDRFKNINDTMGHSVGDRILQEMARRLMAITPNGVELARFGGEEFAMLTDGGEDAASALAHRVMGAVRVAPFVDNEHLITVSISGATATAPERRSVLLRRVEQAMYAAKAGGRDRFVHYEELAREAGADDASLAVRNFEDMTRVFSERAAEIITQRGRQLMESIKHQADVDGLTGLYTRRFMDRRLPYEVSEAERAKCPLTLALLDIDFFGQVNKTHGWPCGDRVLREVAELVRANLRHDDWVARYGGEEFCLVMKRVELGPALRVLDRIRALISHHDFLDERGAPFNMTVSIGAACLDPATYDQQPPAASMLVVAASDQLLIAKRSGRNQVCPLLPSAPQSAAT